MTGSAIRRLPTPATRSNAFRRRAEKRLREVRALDFGSKESNRIGALAVSREIAAARNCTRALRFWAFSRRVVSSVTELRWICQNADIERVAATLITLDRGALKIRYFNSNLGGADKMEIPYRVWYNLVIRMAIRRLERTCAVPSSAIVFYVAWHCSRFYISMITSF